MLNKINLKEEHHYFLIVLTVAVIGVLFLITVSNNESAITGSTTIYITGMQTGTTTPTPSPTATPAPQTAEDCTKKPIGECNDCCASIPNVIEKKNKILAKKTQLGTETSTQKKQTKITIRRNKKDMILALRSCIKTCTTTPRDPFVNLESTKIIHRWYLEYKGMAAQHVHLLGPAEAVHSSGFWKREEFEGMVGLLLDQQLPGTIPVYLIWAPFNEKGYGIQTTRFLSDKKELELTLKDTNWKQKVIDTWNWDDPYTVILKDGTAPIGYMAPPTLSKEEASAVFGGRPVKKMMGVHQLNRDSIYTVTETHLSAFTAPWIKEGLNGVIGWYPTGPVPFKKHVIPGIIQAEDFDNAIGDRLIADFGSEGGDEVAYHDTTLNKVERTYRWHESVDLFGIAGKTNEYRVGDVANEEWMIYTVNVLEDGDYNIEAHLSKETPGDLIEAMKLEIAPNVGVNPTFEFLANFDVQATGSWDTFKVMREKNKLGQKEQGVKLKKGQYLLKLTSLRVENFNIDKIEFNKKTGTFLDLKLCKRYADVNGRANTPWQCSAINRELNTDFVGTVGADDDFDLKIQQTPTDKLENCKLCRRYADNNARATTPWQCAGINQELLTDFVGGVDSNDDFDLKIECTQPVPTELNNLKLCRRYADNNARATTPWQCAGINQELLTDFVGGVDSNDDFDLKIEYQ